jgi:hypothetical protein
MRDDWGTAVEVVDPDGYRLYLFQPPSRGGNHVSPTDPLLQSQARFAGDDFGGQSPPTPNNPVGLHQ